LQVVVLGQGAHQAAPDMRHQIDADQVEQAEHAGPGHAERGHDAIRLLRRQALPEGLERCHRQPVAADAVGDEARCVVAVDHSLAEHDNQRLADPRHAVGVVFLCRHQFHQLHLPRRVEEMGDDEVPGKGFGHALDQCRTGDRRCVGGHDRAGLADRIDPAVKRMLGSEILDDHFDDPVGFGKPVEIVLDIARPHKTCQRLIHETAGFQLPGDTVRGRRTTVGCAAGHVEQVDRHARIGDIDIVEMNEAFASQAEACRRDLGIAPEKLNIDGGAIALGHPLGATGGRLVGKAATLIKREKERRALATQCIGGGMGIAMILEAP
ncbi:MAG: hypothetical protein EOP61_39930, partial [Sphingomonadales bacterium]